MADDNPTPGPEVATPQQPRGPVILSIGLPRTGTASIARALEILGYENVYHTSTAPGPDPRAWALFERAAEASFPKLASPAEKMDKEGDEQAGPSGPPVPAQPRPLWRSDWDPVFGGCDAVTDVPAAFLAPQLLAAYPDARVISVQRAFEPWFDEFGRSVLQPLWGLTGTLALWAEGVLLPGSNSSSGSGGGSEVSTVAGATAAGAERFEPRQRAQRKMILAFFGVARVHAIDAELARARYEAHYRWVRRAVRPDRLLEFSPERDGWEPLCRFLGREVPVSVPAPDAPDGGVVVGFPQDDGPAEAAIRFARYRSGVFWGLFRTLLPFIVTHIVLFAAIAWYTKSR